MVVDDRVDRDLVRDDRMPEARLRIDDHGPIEAAHVDLAPGHHADAEAPHHLAVLGSQHVTAVGEGRRDAERLLDQEAHTEGAAHRIRVRIRVAQHEHALASLERPQKLVDPALGLKDRGHLEARYPPRISRPQGSKETLRLRTRPT